MPSLIVTVRMPVPPTFPGITLLVFLLVMDVEVIIRIPSYLQKVRHDERREVPRVIMQDQRVRSIVGSKIDTLETFVSTQAGVYSI